MLVRLAYLRLALDSSNGQVQVMHLVDCEFIINGDGTLLIQTLPIHHIQRQTNFAIERCYLHSMIFNLISIILKSVTHLRFRLQPYTTFCVRKCVAYVLVCVRVNVCVKVCSKIAKILKNNPYEIEHSQSISISPVFPSLTLTFIFKVKLLAFYFICDCLVNIERYSKHYYCHQIDSYVFGIEWHHY